MKYTEFKNNIQIAGLSINEFADLIKANPKSITNLARNDQETDVPKHLSVIATLMAKMSINGIEFINDIKQLEIQHQKCRVKGKFGGDKQGAFAI